jgi:hypothetical protein
MTKIQRVVEALVPSAYLLDSAFAGANAATAFAICSLEIFWGLGFGLWSL